MRIRPGRWWLRLAPLVLALVAMSATSATSATSAGLAPAPDACFKQVFQKRVVDGSWVVRKCEEGETLRYRVAYRAAQASAAADINIDEIDSILDVKYRIVGPGTLLIDAPAERGGRAYLLHPVDGSTALSVAAFDYMSNDEESLAVRLEGRRIRASTGHGTNFFDIGPTGTLTRVVTPGKPQRPRS
jgi:hypothetical protein